MRRDVVPRLVGVIAATPVAAGFFLLGAVVLVARSLRDAIRTSRGQARGDARREAEPQDRGPAGTVRRDGEEPSAGDTGDWLDEAAGALRDTAATAALVDDAVRVFLSDARAFFVEHPDADTCETVDAGVRKRAVTVGEAVRILMWPASAPWNAEPTVDRTFANPRAQR